MEDESYLLARTPLTDVIHFICVLYTEITKRRTEGGERDGGMEGRRERGKEEGREGRREGAREGSVIPATHLITL